MSVDFQNGFVLGLTAIGKYIYQAKQMQGFETTMPVISVAINDIPVADDTMTMPTSSVGTVVT
jgi:hypothetical protein